MAVTTDGLIRAMAASVAIVLAAGASAAERAASDWFPSEYGAHDTLGAANRLSPAHVRGAARLVTRGAVYALGMRIDSSVSNRAFRKYGVTVVQPGGGDGRGAGSNHLTVNDDVVTAWQGIGTQIDGLAHAGIGNVYYNGAKAADFVGVDGVRKFGIADVPPLVSRGVVLDIAGLKGVASLPAGAAIGRADIEAAAERQEVDIGAGDIVLLHTGWMDAEHARGPDAPTRSPGLGLEGARYLADLGVVAVGSDTFAVEVWPAEDPTQWAPVHQELLAKRGVYLLENVVTRELVRDRAWEFLFVLGQPRLVGAVQAIVNPIAIR